LPPIVPNVGSLCVEPGNGVDVHISVSSGIIGAISEITVSDARARLADVVDAIGAAKAARAEIADGDATIPWEQVKADLGPA
jgi:hypothetical protein